jgi:alpha-tubulin suppressor-like RCC1 family protein
VTAPRLRVATIVAVVFAAGLWVASSAHALAATSVASGEDHSCAVMQDATLMCWGLNDGGQLGDGTLVNRNYAVVAVGLSGVVDVAPSRAHTCAVLTGGTVKCWGNGAFGQLGDGIVRTVTAPVLTPVTVSGITTATQVASGSETTCALLQDTTVRCWGRGDYGTRGDGSTTNIVRSPVAVSGLSGVSKIIGGRLHMCALMNDQSLRCWGSNFYGEQGDGTRTTRTTPHAISLPDPVASADGGATGTCAALTSGAVYCWGGNDDGQLGIGSSGTDRLTPVPVSGISSAVQVGLGGQAGCARLLEAITKCWGNGVWNGGVGSTTSPITVPGLAGATSLFVGRSVSCATLASPSVKCWGSNANGSVGGEFWGTGDVSPVTVLGFTATPTLASTPQSPSGSSTATFNLTGGGGTTYECRVDSAPFASCGNPAAVAGLADGERTIRFRALDAAGNPSRATDAFTWTVDISADPPSLGSSVGSFTNQTSALFSISGEPGATFECSLDGAVYAGCSSSTFLGGLSGGAHSFRARQISVLGHVSLPSQFDWTIDATPPAAPQVTRRPPAHVASGSATFSFSGEVGGTFLCSLDGAPEGWCGSPHSVSGLADGMHSLTITQVDQAGNRSEAAGMSWTVDTVAPAAPRFARAPILFSGNPDEVVEVVGEIGATFACSRDRGPVAECPSRQVLGVLPLGPHSLKVQQVDQAGNRSPFASTSWITVPTPPAGDEGVSINDAATYTNKPSVSLDLVWPEGATDVRIANDGGFKTAQTLPIGAKVPWKLASSGAERLPKTVYLRFKGYLVDESKTYTDDIILDETPPQIISASAVGSATSASREVARRGRPVLVRVRARDRTSGVTAMQIASSKSPQAKALPYRATIRTVVAGPRTWVRVRDGAGNWSVWRKAA